MFALWITCIGHTAAVPIHPSPRSFKILKPVVVVSCRLISQFCVSAITPVPAIVVDFSVVGKEVCARLIVKVCGTCDMQHSLCNENCVVVLIPHKVWTATLQYVHGCKMLLYRPSCATFYVQYSAHYVILSVNQAAKSAGHADFIMANCC